MASSGFSKLSRKHGIRVGAATSSPCSVEEVALAVGAGDRAQLSEVCCPHEQSCGAVC